MNTGFNHNKDTDDSGKALHAEGHVCHTNDRGIVISYEGPGGVVKVPEGVRGIGREAFALCTHVTGVILPEGLRFIGERAFSRSGIRTILLPDTLDRIEKLAFSESDLESIEIPDQVMDVEERAFLGAEHLEKVKLPEKILYLRPGLFSGCRSLKEVILPKKLKYIEGKAFMMCSSLEHIELPEELVSVRGEAFSGCSALREIYLGDSVEEIGHDTFRDCRALEKVRIPKGLKMMNCNAFTNADRVVLTGPGQADGLIVADRDIRYFLDSKKLVIPEGVTDAPYYALQALTEIEILDLPGSLENYSYQVFSKLPSLRQIVTDRDAPAAEIALMLDLECVDRNGQKFSFRVPENPGEWIIKEYEDSISIRGCRGWIGHIRREQYTTVIIPDQIGGKPVVSIGEDAFYGYDRARAFYIPDSVRFIGSAAFARNGYCKNDRKIFMRLPRGVRIWKNAFLKTPYLTKESVRKEAVLKAAEETYRREQADFNKKAGHDYAVRAADDPSIGTGTAAYPALKPNIWQYFDRLSREERIQEMTHFFLVEGEMRGAGWAWVDISIDDSNVWFSISYVGPSPADFRSFAEEIEDGESESFGWQAEPGGFSWFIQRRGGILYVNAPEIEEGFFIPHDAFLRGLEGLTGEW